MIVMVIGGWLVALYVLARALLYGVVIVFVLGGEQNARHGLRIVRRGLRAAGWPARALAALLRRLCAIAARVAQYFRRAIDERTAIAMFGLTLTSIGLGMIAPAAGVLAFGLAALAVAVVPVTFPAIAAQFRKRQA